MSGESGFPAAPDQPEWMTVADAAKAANLPPRSVYNWVRTKSLVSRKQDGTTMVRLEEVLARGRARQAKRAKGPALPGAASPRLLPAAQPAARRRSTLPELSAEETSVPPELLAHLIKLFEQGVPLLNIVQELRLPPTVALEARRLYDALVAADGQLGLVERVTQAITQAEERVEEVIAPAEERVEKVIAEAEERMEEFLQRLAQAEERVELLLQHSAQREDENDDWRSLVRERLIGLENAMAIGKLECVERVKREAETARQIEAALKESVDQLFEKLQRLENLVEASSGPALRTRVDGSGHMAGDPAVDALPDDARASNEGIPPIVRPER